ncbi:MAG: M1 family metallopeptidase [Candidatus Saccharimonadales bacterium]|jgi:aminopeptidase N
MTQTLRLYEYFLPKHYDLTLTIEREARRFHGRVVITGHKPHAVHPIMVHAKDLTIQAAMIGDTLVPTTPLRHDAVQIGDGLPAGDYDVTLEFSGTITDPMHGLYPCYYERDGEKHELLATQFESHHAREVFPCIDEPEAKATFDLTLETEADVTVLSNTPEKKMDEGRRTKEEGTKMTQFGTTPRMSTYLLAFVVGELHKTTATSQNGTEVSVYSTLSQAKSSHQFALDEAVALIDHYEAYFGVPYPLSKCDHVALPDFSALAMENWGLITYREGYLLAEDNTPVDQKRSIATVIAHELAHQWFGNLVTMRWWDDLWLNESFANVMEYMSLDALHPDWNVWDDFAAKESTMALGRDQYGSIQPVAYHVKTPDDIAAVFDKAILYCKGSRLIRMTIAYIGEEAFRAALKQYFTDFAYGNTEGHDLWRAMHAASGKHIEALMEHWLRHSGLPVVTVTSDGDSFAVSQHRLSVGHEAEGTHWPIPLAAADDHFPSLLHDHAAHDIAADSPQLNVTGVSHFVTNYDDAAWSQMLDLLDTGRLSAVERGLLLYEAYLLAQSGHTSSERLLDLLPHYAHEESSAVWLIISYVIAALSITAESIVTRPEFDTYVQTLLAPASTTYNLAAAASDDTARKTQGIISELLISYGHAASVSAALDQFRQADDLSDLAGDLQPAVYGAVAAHGTKKDIIRLIHLHSTTRDAHQRDIISRALATSRDMTSLGIWINALSDSESVKLQDLPLWFYYLMRNPVSREATWQWLHDNWPWLLENFGNGHALEKMPMYAAKTLHGDEWLRRYREFFDTHDDPTIRRAVRVGIDEITARTAWIDRDHKVISAQIREH